MCKYITESDIFTSAVTVEIFKKNHHFDCNDKCLVYLLACNRCKRQCTGQKTDHFRRKWNDCKSKSGSFDRGEQYIQEHLYKHFESKSHADFRDDVSVILIDKTDGSKPTKKETY